MTILKQTEQSISKADLEQLAGEFWRKISVLPQHQIFSVANGEVLPKDSFIKKRWRPMVTLFEKILKMESESIEFVYNELHEEICIFINEKMQSESFKMTPVKKVPGLVYWALAKKADERLRQINRKRVKVVFNNDFQEDGIDNMFNDDFQGDEIDRWKNKYGIQEDPKMLNAHCMSFGGKFYILIDGIAEDVGLSSQTLRNWEKKKLITFTHIPYRSMVKKISFLRGVPYDDESTFIEQVRKINQKKYPSIGYITTKEALKKLKIHHT